MRFRWICLLALWTVISGPIIALPVRVLPTQAVAK